MLHVVETSVCVSLIRGRSCFTALPPADQCIVSVITVAELEVGVCRSTRPRDQRRAVDDLLALFPVLDFTAAAVSDYGEIRAALEKKGLAIGPLDQLIAAHARSLGAAVVTANVREFQRVPGLKVVAWK